MLTLPLARACLLSDATVPRHLTAKLRTEMRKRYLFPFCPLGYPDFKTTLSSVHFHLQLVKYIKLGAAVAQ
jgi:tryptophan synthase alpha subunit